MTAPGPAGSPSRGAGIGPGAGVGPIEPGRWAQSGADPRSSWSTLVAATRARGWVELLQFFRSRDSVVFSLALPIVMLGLLASIFSGTIKGTHVTYGAVYTAGLLAGGLASTSFLNLGVVISTERENGALKRLAGTPMPPAAYFLGKVIVVLATSALEIVLVMLVGRLAYGVLLPSSLGRWWTFLWVTLLGGAAMALVGVAASSLPRSSRSAPAVLNLPFLVLEFVSGVFVPFTSLSSGVYSAAGFFPLRWIAAGYRSALLPDSFQSVEPGHSWNHPLMAIVLGAWCLAGLTFSVWTFRWTDRAQR